MSRLLDRVIFVTGAARGIGWASAIAYHATGCILPVSGGVELGYLR